MSRSVAATGPQGPGCGAARRGSDGPDQQQWQRLLPLFREINDLKRVRAPGIHPSLAAAWFRHAAEHLFSSTASADPGRWHDVALDHAHAAIAGTRLAAICVDDLLAGGMSETATEAVFRQAIEERREVLDPSLFDALAGISVNFRDRPLTTTCEREEPNDRSGVDPACHVNQATVRKVSWIERLIMQPRAGATAPGQARIVLEPVESCAEHCMITAVYAVLLAPWFGASVEEAFAIGLAHHLHNAQLPDAGFAGEALIGEHLDDLIATLRTTVLAQMHPGAAARVEPLLSDIAGIDTPLARVFHTADTIDRVLQIEYFARCNQFTLSIAMVDMELVHAGPIQAFQLEQLNKAGLGL